MKPESYTSELLVELAQDERSLVDMDREMREAEAIYKMRKLRYDALAELVAAHAPPAPQSGTRGVTT